MSLAQRLNKAPLRHKLTALVMLTVAVSLGSVGAVFVGFDLLRLRTQLEVRVQQQALEAAFHSRAAVGFKDTAVAEQTLQAFATTDDILQAAIFDAEGTLFARYRRQPSPATGLATHAPAWRGVRWTRSALESAEAVVIDGEELGVVWVQSDRNRLNTRAAYFVVTAILVLLIAFGLTFFVSAHLQHLVLAPLIALDAQAQAHYGDLGAGLGAADDESSALAAAFHRMFEEAKSRERELGEARTRAEAANRRLKKQIELQESTEDQLRQSQKMEAVGRLAGGIAHDFNNLLVVILGFGEILRDELDGDHKIAARHVVDAGKRASDLTRQLLTFSRKSQGQARVIGLDPVVNALEPLLRRLLGETIDLDVSLGSQERSIFADPVHIEQILMNLTINARDAIGGNGKILVRTRVRSDDQSAGGGHLQIEVTDNGPGMSDHISRRVFEPFFTTKPEGRGTGLGLSTVYGIVQTLGGEITLESVVGRGTTFYVELPESVLTPPDVTRSIPVPQERPCDATILLVEDEDSVRIFVEQCLVRAGYKVLLATNGEEALQIMNTGPDKVALVLSDVVMPKLGGVELMERLAETCPTLPVLLMSGYPGGHLDDSSALPEGVDLIRKPFRAVQLLERVSAALHPVSNDTQQPTLS